MIITGKKFSKPAMSRVINGDTVLKSAAEKPEKTRLDLLLVEKYPEYNRSSLQTFIKSGFVKVNGKIAQKPNELFEKTSVNLELSVPEKRVCSADEIPEILFEDNNVKVLNKPAGLLSMTKGEYCPEPTLEDFGLLVHRLDRDTSGVVILAKNPETQTSLRKQFQDRKTHKTYLAVVAGRPKLDAAKIDLPLARNLKRPTTFRVDPNGKPATTFYKVLKTSGDLSLLELKPVTGRTHQLRVHLAYLGTPILGDSVYKTSASEKLLAVLEKTRPNFQRRLFLHAQSLEITIPKGNRRTFEAPVPPDFLNLFS
ncbi:RluA family pseudouridine synthase [Candidatus Saccharibacteria bacterium]|nr:RluA family pseudouridine synthase [Candidatus Saccharibacteria bacterium]